MTYNASLNYALNPEKPLAGGARGPTEELLDSALALFRVLGASGTGDTGRINLGDGWDVDFDRTGVRDIVLDLVLLRPTEPAEAIVARHAMVRLPICSPSTQRTYTRFGKLVASARI